MDNTPIAVLSITKSRISLLETMGIYTVEHLLCTYPYRYDIIKATDLIDHEKVTIEGTLVSVPKVYYRGRFSRFVFTLSYQEQQIEVTVFNRAYIVKQMHIGEVLTLRGVYKADKKQLVASDIYLQPLAALPAITPVYSLKKGISQKSFQGYIKKALLYKQGKIVDTLPIELMQKHSLIHKEMAVRCIHFPQTTKDIVSGLRYLKYEEFFQFQLTMQYVKLHRKEKWGVSKQFDRKKINDFIDTLPFSLTKDQITACQDILDDLQSDQMMYRFVQGDVGSGKTIVGAIAMQACCLAGFQCAFMAPTEILASQHYQALTDLFKECDLHIALLVGKYTDKQKRSIYEQLENGEIDIVVGTHALFQEKVVYHRLGLVIADEQHRFGVKQRKALKDKGKQVDFLVMSATPIPRTLAISLYGDMDVSTIKSMPQGRQSVITKWIKASTMKPILKEVRAYLDSGGQCYVVCPLISESEALHSKDAISIYAAMQAYFKGRYTIGLLHGKMTADQKDEMMQAFMLREIQILVSTTVIEVGVNVVNANMMIIYNAERFGLSQLHQLRGRIGRGTSKAYCYLLSNSSSEEARERLSYITECHDGFALSAFDLKMRGPGDLLGDKQSGLPVFTIASISQDGDILEVARKDVQLLLESSSQDPAYQRMLSDIKQKLTQNNQYID